MLIEELRTVGKKFVTVGGKKLHVKKDTLDLTYRGISDIIESAAYRDYKPSRTNFFMN